jgi:tetratricopeptide (TPR) repeat protein
MTNKHINLVFVLVLALGLGCAQTAAPTNTPMANPVATPTDLPGTPTTANPDYARLNTVEIFCPTDSDPARQAFNDGKDFADQGQPDKAELAYRQAIELDAGYCDAYDNLGLILRRQGRVDEAIELYLQSLEILPTNEVALQNLGLAYRLQGKFEEAQAAYQRLIDANPDNPEGHFGLGSVYIYLDQPDRAIPSLERAEALYRQYDSPYVADAHYYLGYAYFLQQDCRPAIDYLEPIYSEMSEDPGINYFLGICYLGIEPQDVERAKTYLQKAQALGIEIPQEVKDAVGLK